MTKQKYWNTINNHNRNPQYNTKNNPNIVPFKFNKSCDQYHYGKYNAMNGNETRKYGNSKPKDNRLNEPVKIPYKNPNNVRNDPCENFGGESETIKYGNPKAKDFIWNKAVKIPNKNPDNVRVDPYGNLINYNDYGKHSKTGWQIDHIKPKSKGGSDQLSNLQALQSKKNSSLGNDTEKKHNVYIQKKINNSQYLFN